MAVKVNFENLSPRDSQFAQNFSQKSFLSNKNYGFAPRLECLVLENIVHENFFIKSVVTPNNLKSLHFIQERF